MGSKGLWCQSCAKRVDRPEFADGKLCCSFCGRVVSEDNWSEEVTFAKDSSGQSRAQGTLNYLASGQSISRERTLQRAAEEMEAIFLSVCNDDDREVVLEPARRFYTIAVERNFTRGRERDLVGAACLYVACRTKNKPYLLIDFAEFLGRNVYELGAVYLLLCKLLSLVEHENIQKPVDPSLFIHRFAHRLLGQKNEDVTRTALKIIASMKRDWMQTGRKPSGLCGAALYISALSHGHKYTKSQIVKIVHICEATLTKRLIEFESTDSGSLTIEEFTNNAIELEAERRSAKQSATGLKVSDKSELLCEHKGALAFAHGLCVKCYEEFIEISGGLDGGSEPPAFQRAQQERMEKEYAEENADSSYDTTALQGQNSSYLKSQKKLDSLEARDEDEHFTEGDIGSATKHPSNDDDSFNKMDGTDVLSDKGCDDSETLSDIDDIEVNGYIHNEEEQQYKKIIWEELNREYEEERKAKEDAEAAANKAYEEILRNCPEGMEEARQLAADAAAAAAKIRKERQQKRAAEARNLPPPQTAAEATRQMLAKKRLDSKINYAVLDELFEEPNPKKRRIDDVVQNDESKLESGDRKEDSKLVSDDEYENVAAEEFAEESGGDYDRGGYEQYDDFDNDYEFDEY